MRKRIMKVLVCFVSIFVLSLSFSTINVQALTENKKIETRAIEKYTKSVDVVCGNYGYVRVKVTISHNMTTGKMTVDSVTYDKMLNSGYAGVGVSSVTTSPAVGSTITGNTIKVTVNYYQIGIINTNAYGTIYL